MSRNPKILLSLFGLLLATGCGSQYPSVSGTITADGEPVAGVTVCFNPVSTRDNPFPGPYAQAETDKEGRYCLVTRDGSAGATVGENVVELYSSAANELGFQESKAEVQLASARMNQDRQAFLAAAAIKKKVQTLQSLSSGNRMTPAVTTRFVVPIAGTDSADFDLIQLTSPDSSL